VRSFGQSMNTWVIVSLAPHSHLSSALFRILFPCVASHEWPVLSCVKMCARALGSGS
jgi:hypothetical protein